MYRATLKNIIWEFHTSDLPDLFPREVELPLDTEKIVSLSGIRKAGKTSIFFNTIKKLLDSGVSKENILYINFENDQMFPFDEGGFNQILEVYYELFPRVEYESKYLFFDEIESVNGWPDFLSKLYKDKFIHLYFSSSSNRTTTFQFPKMFQGRLKKYEIFPLSFKEFLDFSGVKPETHSPAIKLQMVKSFEEYSKFGGFPEVVLAPREKKQGILTSYVNTILYKDILEKHGLKNSFLMKYLLKYCVLNTGNIISINKIFTDLKQRDISVSKNTLYEYFEALRNSYVIKLLSKYETSHSKTSQSQKRVYMVDTGLMIPFHFDDSGTMNSRVRNMIFLDLLRDQKNISYFKKRKEIDFVIKSGQDVEFINLAPEFTNRDHDSSKIKSFYEGLKVFPKANSRLLYSEYWQESSKAEGFFTQPAWEFFTID